MATKPHPLLPPSPWIIRFTEQLPIPSRVLDVACGAGRHTRILAAAGHHVTAVDRDLTELEGFTPTAGSVDLVNADLEDGSPWPLEGSTYDVVVVANYLWRPLFPVLREALADNGLLVYETFAAGNERFGKPSNPAFLLNPGELLTAFGSDLQVLAFEQGQVLEPKPAVLQRICALNASQDKLPLQPSTR